MKRMISSVLLIVFAIIGGIIGMGWMRDRAFVEENQAPGKLLRAGPFNIHVIESQGSSQRTVVFIHGNPGTAEDFSEIQKRLAPKIRTISVDRPGYGWSDRPRDEMDPRAQARMIRDALKGLAVQNPVLVGFSFGGPVITAYALEYPDEVAALVYLCAVADPVEGHKLQGPQAKLIEPVLGKAIAYGIGPYAAPDAVEKGYLEAFSPKPVDRDVVDRGKVQFIRPTTLLASAWDWRMLELSLPKLAARYGELSLPVEALSSNQDKIVGPSHIKYLAEHVKKIHVAHLEGAGHQVMTTHPNDVVLAVLRAIDRSK
jgi:pimeloyl-ACP methyl ester carboxylesterase